MGSLCKHKQSTTTLHKLIKHVTLSHTHCIDNRINNPYMCTNPPTHREPCGQLQKNYINPFQDTLPQYTCVTDITIPQIRVQRVHTCLYYQMVTWYSSVKDVGGS